MSEISVPSKFQTATTTKETSRSIRTRCLITKALEEGPLSKRELAKATGLSLRNLKKLLPILQINGFIVLTIPDKPKIHCQKYKLAENARGSLPFSERISMPHKQNKIKRFFHFFRGKVKTS
jgi:hypothetical protein